MAIFLQRYTHKVTEISWQVSGCGVCFWVYTLECIPIIKHVLFPDDKNKIGEVNNTLWEIVKDDEELYEINVTEMRKSQRNIMKDIKGQS